MKLRFIIALIAMFNQASAVYIGEIINNTDLRLLVNDIFSSTRGNIVNLFSLETQQPIKRENNNPGIELPPRTRAIVNNLTLPNKAVHASLACARPDQKYNHTLAMSLRNYCNAAPFIGFRLQDDILQIIGEHGVGEHRVGQIDILGDRMPANLGNRGDFLSSYVRVGEGESYSIEIRQRGKIGLNFGGVVVDVIIKLVKLTPEDLTPINVKVKPWANANMYIPGPSCQGRVKARIWVGGDVSKEFMDRFCKILNRNKDICTNSTVVRRENYLELDIPATLSHATLIELTNQAINEANRD
jgi:hypothetical protein